MSFDSAGDGEGAFVTDLDAEPEVGDGEDGVALGYVESVGDEESRKNLREHLRRTLTQKREVSADTVVEGPLQNC